MLLLLRSYIYKQYYKLLSTNVSIYINKAKRKRKCKSTNFNFNFGRIRENGQDTKYLLMKNLCSHRAEINFNFMIKYILLNASNNNNNNSNSLYIGFFGA